MKNLLALTTLCFMLAGCGNEYGVSEEQIKNEQKQASKSIATYRSQIITQIDRIRKCIEAYKNHPIVSEQGYLNVSDSVAEKALALGKQTCFNKFYNELRVENTFIQNIQEYKNRKELDNYSFSSAHQFSPQLLYNKAQNPEMNYPGECMRVNDDISRLLAFEYLVVEDLVMEKLPKLINQNTFKGGVMVKSLSIYSLANGDKIHFLLLGVGSSDKVQTFGKNGGIDAILLDLQAQYRIKRDCILVGS